VRKRLLSGRRDDLRCVGVPEVRRTLHQTI
jgi:hypothetical protein